MRTKSGSLATERSSVHSNQLLSLSVSHLLLSKFHTTFGLTEFSLWILKPTLQMGLMREARVKQLANCLTRTQLKKNPVQHEQHLLHCISTYIFPLCDHKGIDYFCFECWFWTCSAAVSGAATWKVSPEYCRNFFTISWLCQHFGWLISWQGIHAPISAHNLQILALKEGCEVAACGVDISEQIHLLFLLVLFLKKRTFNPHSLQQPLVIWIQFAKRSKSHYCKHCLSLHCMRLLWGEMVGACFDMMPPLGLLPPVGKHQ